MQVKSGIILAGGTGSRLAPLNSLFNKHLVPVYNKFIIDYPLDTLKNLGVTDLTIVLGGSHFSQVVSHVKDGSHLGMTVNYVYQDKPMGIAQAVNLCKNFVSGDFVVILGDNIFEKPVKLNPEQLEGAQIVLHSHPELHRFGVAGIDSNKEVKLLVEKPKTLDEGLDHYAVTGCYKFDNQFFDYFSNLQPSARGEYEIVDIIKKYLENGKLHYTFVEGMWSDAGTHESINFVNNFFYNKQNESL
jgi:glucose-1-phosphate thymidylyltransferase